MLATITIYALCTFGPGGCGAAGDGFDATRPADLRLARAFKSCVNGLQSGRGSLANVRTACAKKLGIALDDGTNYHGPMVSLDDGKPITPPPIPPASLRTIACPIVHATVTLEALGPHSQPFAATIVTTSSNGAKTSQRVTSKYGTDLWATCVGVQIAISEVEPSHRSVRRVRVFNRANDLTHWTEFTGDFNPYTENLPAPPSCDACAAAKAYWDAVDLDVRRTANVD